MKYHITVDGRPDCCEVGAFGLNFAHGTAETDSAAAADWFRTHDGYTVTEAAPDEPKKGKKDDPA